jgi:Competence protein CoiA-like family
MTDRAALCLIGKSLRAKHRQADFVRSRLHSPCQKSSVFLLARHSRVESAANSALVVRMRGILEPQSDRFLDSVGNDRVAIAYGLAQGVLKHVEEVPRGKACGCTCVRCGDALVARRGKQRVPHFSHLHESDCDGGVETILHRLAKELLAEMRSIVLPKYVFSRKQYVGIEEVSYEAEVRPEKLVSYDDTEVERSFADIIPDIVIKSGEHKLIVEVAVSHRVDEGKLARVATLGFPAVEIRLDRADACLSREELRQKLATDVSCKYWLFHPSQRRHEEKYRDRVSREEQRQRDEGRERRRFYRETLKRAQRPMAVRQDSSKASSMKEFLEQNAIAESFNAKHGHYPSLEETRASKTKPGKS